MQRMVAVLALGLAMAVIAGPAVADPYAQMRAQVERGLIHLGIPVPGGVESLSEQQLKWLLLEVNDRERDPGRRQRIERIIAAN
jgi:hypothetical protein